MTKKCQILSFLRLQEARRGGTEEKASKYVERLFKMINIIKNDNDDDNDINDYCLKASKHAERLFKMIDIDGDGNLTQNEFLRVGD